MKPDTLTDLLSTKNVEEFCRRFFSSGGADPARLPLLCRDVCRHTASHIYPEKYAPPLYFLPHSYMGLIGAWQARQYLKKSDWWRPLLQAFWYVATELQSWGVRDEATAREMKISPEKLRQAFSRAYDTGDLGTLYSLYVACRGKPQLASLATKSLLSIAMTDYMNIGHKYIYLAKVIQLMEDTGWQDTDLLYAPMHFLVVAPKKLDIFLEVQAALEPHAGKLVAFSANRKPLPGEEAIQLRDAITSRGANLPQLIIDFLTRGYSVESIADSLLLAAAHLVYYASAEDLKYWWVYPVHGFNFTGSLRYGLKFLEPQQKALAVLLNGLYLSDTVQSLGGVSPDGSIESVRRANKTSFAELEEAVEGMSVVAALEQISGLREQATFAEMAEKLVLLASRTEKFLFTHVIKYLYYVLQNINSPSPWSTQHLLAFVRFLTLTTKERGVTRIATEAARHSGETS